MLTYASYAKIHNQTALDPLRGQFHRLRCAGSKAMTYEALGVAIGLGKGTLVAFATGKGNPTFTTLSAISRWCDEREAK